MTHVSHEHPTREDWAARKAGLPSEALASLARIAEHRAHVQAEARLQAARELAEADDWRAKFEAAVSLALSAAEAGWLADYRVPDHMLSEFVPFRSASDTFRAVFGASAAGLWPIVLTLAAGNGHCREWLPVANPWQVSRPRGLATYRTFALALEVAAAHCAPF